MPQQTQPLVSAIVSPSREAISAASMAMAPKSLTSTPMRRVAVRSRWLTKVVLPAPRKPPITVSGTHVHALSNTRPPDTVARTLMSRICIVSIASGSPSSTAKSANFPTSMLPMR